MTAAGDDIQLAADVSRSMDLEEAALVRRGFVHALRHPDVIDAIRRGRLGRIGQQSKRTRSAESIQVFV